MIRWLSSRQLVAIHHALIREHGGPRGIRDSGLLESALARPRNLHAYDGETDPCRLATAYGWGICRDHPFVDGNKRVALMTMYVFLKLNGLELTASEADAVVTMLELAAGNLSEHDLAQWLKENSTKT